MKDRLIKHNAAIDAEGPDWWRRLSPNGGKPRGADAPKKKARPGKAA